MYGMQKVAWKFDSRYIWVSEAVPAMLCFGTSIMSEHFTINAGISHCLGKTRPPNLNLAMEFAVQWNVRIETCQ